MYAVDVNVDVEIDVVVFVVVVVVVPVMLVVVAGVVVVVVVAVEVEVLQTSSSQYFTPSPSTEMPPTHFCGPFVAPRPQFFVAASPPSGHSILAPSS